MSLGFSQQRTIQVVKRWLGDEGAQVDSIQGASLRSFMARDIEIDSAKKDSRKLKEWEQKYQPMNEGGLQANCDYVEYYHRVKEFGKQRKWDDRKTNQMLGDRKAFEKVFKLVSK